MREDEVFFLDATSDGGVGVTSLTENLPELRQHYEKIVYRQIEHERTDEEERLMIQFLKEVTNH